MELQEKMPVPIFTGADREVFLRHICPQRRPAVLRGVCLGPCLEKWTVEYLAQRGGDKEVKIHVSTVPQMDFLRKNFAYKTLPFSEFVKRASEKKHSDFFLCEDESYYLRSLGEDVRKEPADLSKQFPALAEDFHVPRFFEPEQFFSSVFRISSCGLQLWTHYDFFAGAAHGSCVYVRVHLKRRRQQLVLKITGSIRSPSSGLWVCFLQVMDNLLAQVTGTKRVVLYSPQDALHLYLSGDKSEVLDVDAPDLNQFPDFVKAKRYECVLEPGDLLFIPALWFHNTTALQFGVGVNVFWRHLPADSYDQKDPYGNKDPVAATRALQVLERALHILDELPPDYRDFYGRRMIQRIQKRTYCDSLSATNTQEDCGSASPSRQFTKPG